MSEEMVLSTDRIVFYIQGGRVKLHLNYCKSLDWVKCTGLRFSRMSPGTRRKERGETYGHFQRGVDQEALSQVA
jgi:hypothetical protein